MIDCILWIICHHSVDRILKDTLKKAANTFVGEGQKKPERNNAQQNKKIEYRHDYDYLFVNASVTALMTST
jgi:hypothetical protein